MSQQNVQSENRGSKPAAEERQQGTQTSKNVAQAQQIVEQAQQKTGSK